MYHVNLLINWKGSRSKITLKDCLEGMVSKDTYIKHLATLQISKSLQFHEN